MANNQVRVIVYEMKDGKEEVFKIDSVEMEQHAHAAAEIEMRSRGTHVVGYHFEWRKEETLEKSAV